jgi:hypothetical protein
MTYLNRFPNPYNAGSERRAQKLARKAADVLRVLSTDLFTVGVFILEFDEQSTD